MRSVTHIPPNLLPLPEDGRVAQDANHSQAVMVSRFLENAARLERVKKFSSGGDAHQRFFPNFQNEKHGLYTASLVRNIFSSFLCKQVSTSI
jgi:hypothetical protein